MPIFPTSVSRVETWRRIWRTVAGSRNCVRRRGLTVGSALGTDMQPAGCLGWVRYGAHMSSGSIGTVKGCQGVWGIGWVGWHSLQLRGLCAGNRCWQCHLWGKGASVAASVFKWPSGFMLCDLLNSSCRFPRWSRVVEHSPNCTLRFCWGTKNLRAALCSQLGSQPTGRMAKTVPCT